MVVARRTGACLEYLWERGKKLELKIIARLSFGLLPLQVARKADSTIPSH